MTTPDPPEPGAASRPYTISLAVRWADLDGNGHVANSKYLACPDCASGPGGRCGMHAEDTGALTNYRDLLEGIEASP